MGAMWLPLEQAYKRLTHSKCGSLKIFSALPDSPRCEVFGLEGGVDDL